MRYLADLHVHSPYSLATSKSATLSNFAAWATVKGLNLIGGAANSGNNYCLLKPVFFGWPDRLRLHPCRA